MTTPLQFHYVCPKCGVTTTSKSSDLETCTVPVYGDGEPVVFPIPPKTYADFPTCGGDLGDWGPSVWWWQVPEDIQEEIMKREAAK